MNERDFYEEADHLSNYPNEDISNSPEAENDSNSFALKTSKETVKGETLSGESKDFILI